MMDTAHRSGCPINLSVEVFGDRWTLIILRDMIFGGHRHFRELLTKSLEGISSNILADRLKRLMDEGMITRAGDPTHKQKAVYSLTEKAIQLVPIMAHLGAWGSRHLPVTEELSIRAKLLEEGGPEMWERFMAELREEHLGIPTRHRGPTVGEQLQAAYENVAGAKRGSKTGRTDRASRVISAAPEAIYAAFVDPQSLLKWLPPEGMTGSLDRFDLRVGGSYRMTLTYLDTEHFAPGKTSADADVVEGRFLEIVPNRRIVQAIRFDSEDPAFAGTMTMTWSLAEVPDGTEVTILCENVPAGIRKEDHDAGLTSTLENLAACVA